MQITRIKQACKQVLLAMPEPFSSALVSLACATGVASPIFRIYQKMGRPTRVLSGPFEGMNYRPIAFGSAWVPKFLGTYEKELNPYLERLKAEPCDVIVNVGSAEGYFGIGLARMLAAQKVYCFDIDPGAPRLLAQIAAINGLTDRVISGGLCLPATLEEVLAPARDPLLMCDCEGGEFDLLRPDEVPTLRRTRMVVEIHDYGDSTTIGGALRERFSASHVIETVPVAPRTLDDFPAGFAPQLTDGEKLTAMEEARGTAAGWLVLLPRS